MNRKELIEIIKSVTLGDIIGAVSLILILYIGLFLALIYQ